MKKIIDIFYRDERFLNEILINKEYERCFNDLVIIDIGANIGTFSLYTYNKTRITYAIEPARENVEFLEQTKKENKLDKIKIFEMAICGDDKELKLKKNGEAGKGGWCLKENGTIKVKIKTLAEFMNDEKIDFVDILKIDVEGNEKEIFQASDFPEASKRISTIFGELHQSLGEDQARTLLEKLNFRFKAYKDQLFIAKKIWKK